MQRQHIDIVASMTKFLVIKVLKVHPEARTYQQDKQSLKKKKLIVSDCRDVAKRETSYDK
jgi:hypothetical protein